MGILSRLAGFAVVGPIGLIEGKTEARKRAEAQLAEMKKQTALIEGTPSGRYAATRPRNSIGHAFSPSPHTPTLCGICSHVPDWHEGWVPPLEDKTCPDCAEEVRFAARKCRFCGYMFTDAPTDA